MHPIPTVSHHRLQRDFLAVLPRIVLHARISFRHLRCTHARDEAVAEVVALAWKWFARLDRRGKQPEKFVSAIAAYAARAVKSGRRLCGQERAKDVLSPLAQRRHAFAATTIHRGDVHPSDPLGDALQDNTRTPVPEQVSFRLDFPAWLATRTERDRALIGDLMAGERATDLSARHEVSQGRISQLRHAYHDDWTAFCTAGEPR